MANWFECKVTYHKIVENGLQKKVTDTFMVDALSFTEAEARVTEEVTPVCKRRLLCGIRETDKDRRNIPR